MERLSLVGGLRVFVALFAVIHLNAMVDTKWTEQGRLNIGRAIFYTDSYGYDKSHLEPFYCQLFNTSAINNFARVQSLLSSQGKLKAHRNKSLTFFKNKESFKVSMDGMDRFFQEYLKTVIKGEGIQDHSQIISRTSFVQTKGDQYQYGMAVNLIEGIKQEKRFLTRNTIMGIDSTVNFSQFADAQMDEYEYSFEGKTIILNEMRMDKTGSLFQFISSPDKNPETLLAFIEKIKNDVPTQHWTTGSPSPAELALWDEDDRQLVDSELDCFPPENENIETPAVLPAT